MLMTVARPSPANTLIVDDRIVISTATAGLGPALESTPTCQRCAVLKNLAWPVRSLRKRCGGGAGGDRPSRNTSTVPRSQRRAPPRRSSSPGEAAKIGGDRGHAATAAPKGTARPVRTRPEERPCRFVFQLRIDLWHFLDSLFEQRQSIASCPGFFLM